MRRTWLILWTIVGMTLLAMAQETDVQALQRDVQALREELARVARASRMAEQQALTARQEAQAKQATELQAYAEAIRQQNDNIKTLVDQIAVLRDDNKKLKESLAEMPARWQRDIAAETQARQAADRQLGEQVATTVAKAVNDIAGQVDQHGAELRRLDHRVNPPPPPPPAPGTETYTVQKGDTLSAIAKACGVTVEAIKTVNQLTSDTILVGQKLKLPEKP